MGKLYCCLLMCGMVLLTVDLKAQTAFSESTLIFSTDKQIATISDSTSLFTIREIFITGNKRTRNPTVLRELSFHQNESYPLNEIIEKFYKAKEQLMNTGLFRRVEVSLRSLQDHNVYVSIEVEEKWYLYPLPFVNVVDGKFSKWWNEKGHRLDELNYGIRLTQNNLSGRNDQLFIYLMGGYTNQVEIDYKRLYLDKSLKWYANLSIAFGREREVNYATMYNKQVPVKNSNDYLHNFTQFNVDVTYRPAIKTRHIFSFGWIYDSVADTVLKLNQYYYPSERAIRYPAFAYTFSYTDFDFNPYPTKGLAAEFSIGKSGITLPVNMWQLQAKASKFWHIGEKNFFNLKAIGLIKLPFDQPYILQQFLGSNGLYLQGYEKYMIDGVAGGLVKAAIIHPVLKTAIPIPNNKVSSKFKFVSSIPIKIFAKAYVDAGYVYNPNYEPYNSLNNKVLCSTGVGLDVIVFTDFVFKIEWSLNQLGQNGLYLHQREKF